jgi:hypothetical protein
VYGVLDILEIGLRIRLDVKDMMLMYNLCCKNLCLWMLCLSE